MTRIMTAGTHSCATISIACFGDSEVKRNKDYQETGGFKEDKRGKTILEFVVGVLLPVSQPMGKTKHYPFSFIMEQAVKGPLGGKYTTVLLNSYQYNADEGYWPKELAKWEFELSDKTKNHHGQMCYIYVRNLSRPKNDEMLKGKFDE